MVKENQSTRISHRPPLLKSKGYNCTGDNQRCRFKPTPLDEKNIIYFSKTHLKLHVIGRHVAHWVSEFHMIMWLSSFHNWLQESTTQILHDPKKISSTAPLLTSSSFIHSRTALPRRRSCAAALRILPWLLLPSAPPRLSKGGSPPPWAAKTTQRSPGKCRCSSACHGRSARSQ